VIFSVLNLLREIGGPGERVGEREVAFSFLGDGSVPDGMQVGLGAIESDVDPVAA